MPAEKVRAVLVQEEGNIPVDGASNLCSIDGLTAVLSGVKLLVGTKDVPYPA